MSNRRVADEKEQKMSEQLNPTAEEGELKALDISDLQALEATIEPKAATPETRPKAPLIKTGPVSLRDRAEDEATYEEDEDEERVEEGDDEDLYVEGPAEYVERERGTRSRRVGADVHLEDVDYKNIPLLSRFLDRRGRILSRRKTRVTAKMQRRVVRAIKRARHLALLPYTSDQTRIVRKRR
jgi:small subunit ribosomal protein S18